MKDCAQRALKIFVTLTINNGFSRPNRDDSFWPNAIRSIQTQWGLAKNLTHATEAFMSTPPLPGPDTSTGHELAETNVKN